MDTSETLDWKTVLRECSSFIKTKCGYSARHVDPLWGNAEYFLVFESQDSEHHPSAHNRWQSRRHTYNKYIAKSDEKDLTVWHSGVCYQVVICLVEEVENWKIPDKSNHSHQSDKFHGVTLKFEVDFLWIKNISNKTTLGCQESCVRDKSCNWLVTYRSILNDKSATKECILAAPINRIRLMIHIWQGRFNHRNWLTSKNCLIDDAASLQNQ